MLACAELQRRKIDIPRMRGSECAEPMRDAIRLIGQGNAALERGDLDVAAALYAEAAASKPDCALAWERTARLAVNRNRPEEADRALGELAKLLGDEPRFLALRAEIEQDFGQYRPAVADLEKALARSPHQPLAESQLATLFAACPDESIRNGKRAVELAEDLASRADVPYAEAYSVLASAYAEVGQFPDAIRFGEAALRHSSGKERASLEEQLKNFREQHPWRMKPAHAAGDSIPTHTVE
jgi:tetratricopeptide (TPR) repeat protein